MLPWGITHQIVGQDLAWEFQPYIAFLAGMISMTGWAIARPFIRSEALRALVVFIAAQAALIYGYSLWGGIKEVAAALVLLVIAACVLPVIESGARIRSFLPLGVAVFAMLGVNGYDGAVWLPATLVVAGGFSLWLWVRRRGLAPAGRAGGGGGGDAGPGHPVGQRRDGQHRADLLERALGNLAHRVRPLQLLGVWPTADFRIDPPNAAVLTYLLIAVVFVGIVIALIVSWQERSWILALAAPRRGGRDHRRPPTAARPGSRARPSPPPPPPSCSSGWSAWRPWSRARSGCSGADELSRSGDGLAVGRGIALGAVHRRRGRRPLG